MRYRIVQKSENSFIPQCRESFLYCWKGIDKMATLKVNLYPIWYTEKYQDIYCSVETYQEAIEIITCFDKFIKWKNESTNSVKYPIIYDL